MRLAVHISGHSLIGLVLMQLNTYWLNSFASVNCWSEMYIGLFVFISEYKVSVILRLPPGII